MRYVSQGLVNTIARTNERQPVSFTMYIFQIEIYFGKSLVMRSKQTVTAENGTEGFNLTQPTGVIFSKSTIDRANLFITSEISLLFFFFPLKYKEKHPLFIDLEVFTISWTETQTFFQHILFLQWGSRLLEWKCHLHSKQQPALFVLLWISVSFSCVPANVRFSDQTRCLHTHRLSDKCNIFSDWSKHLCHCSKSRQTWHKSNKGLPHPQKKSSGTCVAHNSEEDKFCHYISWFRLGISYSGGWSRLFLWSRPTQQQQVFLFKFSVCSQCCFDTDKWFWHRVHLQKYPYIETHISE